MLADNCRIAVLKAEKYNIFLIALKLQGRISISLPIAHLEHEPTKAGRLVCFEEN